MKKRPSRIGVFAAIACVRDGPIHCQRHAVQRAVTMKVGQSALVKGVRHRDCGAQARVFSDYRPQLPRTALGTFSDGGVGTTRSDAAEVVFRRVA